MPIDANRPQTLPINPAATILYLRDVRLIAIVLLLTAFGSGCDRALVRAQAGGPRIVSLAPSVTETLFALGVGDEVVGVSQYCDYPPAVNNLPRVGTFITPNLEAIAALRPTLVIGLSTVSDVREFRALKAMGIVIVMADDSSVETIEHSIIKVGDAVGRSVKALEIVRSLKAHLQEVVEEMRTQPSRTVLMVVGHQPMVAVGKPNFLDELLVLAHADNIGARANQGWPRLSLEYIIAMRPEVILDGQMGNDPATTSHFWDRYPSIPAVANHRIFGYPEDPTLRPGPRIGATLDYLARRIHPEAFRDYRAPEDIR
jgi:iron complex transport system substrate-binding protein